MPKRPRTNSMLRPAVPPRARTSTDKKIVVPSVAGKGAGQASASPAEPAGGERPCHLQIDF